MVASSYRRLRYQALNSSTCNQEEEEEEEEEEETYKCSITSGLYAIGFKDTIFLSLVKTSIFFLSFFLSFSPFFSFFFIFIFFLLFLLSLSFSLGLVRFEISSFT